MHLNQNDRIVVHKDFVNKLNLQKAKAYRLPYFFKGDDFLEQNLSYFDSRIVYQEEDFIVVNKDHNVVSQPGNNSRVNLVFMANMWLYDRFGHEFSEYNYKK